MCGILKVSRSGYYSWINRPESNRSIKNERILEILQKSHKKAPMAGLDSLWHDVLEQIPCCRGTVYRIMKEMGSNQNVDQSGNRQLILNMIYL